MCTTTAPTTKVYKPMSEKQYNFVQKLFVKFYASSISYENFEPRLKNAFNAKKDVMPMWLASKVIDYVKSEIEVEQEAWGRIIRGQRGGSDYYARNCDLYGEEEDWLIGKINAL